MAFGQIDPARLEGDALNRWYLRSPAEIEEERRQAASRAYDAFFSGSDDATQQSSNDEPEMAPTGDPVGLVRLASNSGGKDKKQDCIEQCTDLTLPTDNYGADFFRCLHQCMGIGDYPEWRPYFPSARMSPQVPRLPPPPAAPAKPPSSGIGNMFPSLANPPSGPWWLPLALPAYVPNS